MPVIKLRCQARKSIAHLGQSEVWLFPDKIFLRNFTGPFGWKTAYSFYPSHILFKKKSEIWPNFSFRMDCVRKDASDHSWYTVSTSYLKLHSMQLHLVYYCGIYVPTVSAISSANQVVNGSRSPFKTNWNNRLHNRADATNIHTTVT